LSVDGGRAVLENARGLGHPLAQGPHELIVVRRQGSTGEHLHRARPHARVLVDHVAHLEALERLAEDAVVGINLESGVGLQVAVAFQSLDDFGQCTRLPIGEVDGRRLVGEIGLRGDEGLDRRKAALGPRLVELFAQPGGAGLGGFLVLRRAQGDALDRGEQGVVDLAVTGLLLVAQEPGAHHPEGGRQPEEFEEVLRTRREFAAVAVRAIVGEADVDGPVAVGEVLALLVLELGENVGRPVVAQVQQGEALPGEALRGHGPRAVRAVDEDPDRVRGIGHRLRRCARHGGTVRRRRTGERPRRGRGRGRGRDPGARRPGGRRSGPCGGRRRVRWRVVSIAGRARDRGQRQHDGQRPGDRPRRVGERRNLASVYAHVGRIVQMSRHL
jgi:hypothetical protein